MTIADPLAHAWPFLFVDPRMVEHGGELRVTAVLESQNPYIGTGEVARPILLEVMAQAMAQHGMLGRQGRGVLIQMKNVSFHRDLRAPSNAYVVVHPIRIMRGIGLYRTELFVVGADGERALVCEAGMSAAHLPM